MTSEDTYLRPEPDGTTYDPAAGIAALLLQDAGWTLSETSEGHLELGPEDSN